MDNERKLKAGDQVRNKQTGQEMEITKIINYFDFSLNKSVETNRVECNYWENNKNSNTISEFDINEIEPID